MVVKDAQSGHKPQPQKRQLRSAKDYPDLPNQGRVMPDLERAARLRQARIAAGYQRPVDAIRAFGWNRSTYNGHENGSRGIPRDRLEEYSRAFRVNHDWLSSGRGSMRAGRQMVRIEGDVIEHGTIIERGKTQEIEEIECPAGYDASQFAGYRVRGDGNLPLWEDGDVIVARRPSRDFVALLGKRCIVTLENGTRRIVRRLLSGSHPAVFTLISYTLAPRQDVELLDVAEIVLIIINSTPLA
jgi:phage repressor protein C with HTH and peptisase S24 domain